MKKSTKIELIPKWTLNQKIKYKIYRKDHFSYSGRQRYPIENSYELHLKVLKIKDKIIEIEAYYPFSYLYLLTSFQSFRSLIGKEELIQPQKGNQFKYFISEDGTFIKIKKPKNIKEEFKVIESNIRNSNLKKKQRKRMIGEISYLVKSKKDVKNYLVKDIELIHRLYGKTIPLNRFHDNSEKPNNKKIEKEIRKLKRKEYKFFKSLNYNFHELNFVNTFQKKSEQVVDEISGLNLVSVDLEDRHDLSKIKKDYLNNKFKIEGYNNITLHQKTSEFDLKGKHLTSYSHERRTVSNKMQKIEKIKIEKIKKKTV